MTAIGGTNVTAIGGTRRPCRRVEFLGCYGGPRAKAPLSAPSAGAACREKTRRCDAFLRLRLFTPPYDLEAYGRLAPNRFTAAIVVFTIMESLRNLSRTSHQSPTLLYFLQRNRRHMPTAQQRLHLCLFPHSHPAEAPFRKKYTSNPKSP